MGGIGTVTMFMCLLDPNIHILKLSSRKAGRIMGTKRSYLMMIYVYYYTL